MLASSVDDDDPTHTIVTLTSYDSRPHRRIFRLISRGRRGRAGSRKRLRRCLVLFSGPGVLGHWHVQLKLVLRIRENHWGLCIQRSVPSYSIIFHHIPSYSTTLHSSTLSVYIYIMYIYIYTIYIYMYIQYILYMFL
jgi:hypothetical protein